MAHDKQMRNAAIIIAWLPCYALAAIALNPDVHQDTIAETICIPGYTKTVRPPVSYTNKVKRRLMFKAGIEQDHISEYELDHIVPLALGGAPRNPENLQLQPWNGNDGAHRKDRIEVKLQCLVCSGQVTLADAQEEIYTDWQATYHKYAKMKCHRPKRH